MATNRRQAPRLRDLVFNAPPVGEFPPRARLAAVGLLYEARSLLIAAAPASPQHARVAQGLANVADRLWPDEPCDPKSITSERKAR